MGKTGKIRTETRKVAMTQKTQALTYPSAIETFFGGVKGLAKQPLPFTCRCGDSTYLTKEKNGESWMKFEKPIMSIEECFKHIRRSHKERIKKQYGT